MTKTRNITALAVGFPMKDLGNLQRNAMDMMLLRHVRSVGDIVSRPGEGDLGLIITYYRPEKGGLDHQYRDIQEKAPGVTTVLAMPFADHRCWIDALEAGFQDVITFPFHRDDLSHMVNSAAR